MTEQIFVGRDTEMATLKTALEKARDEAVCQICLIEGDAGTGKTTLIEQFAQLTEELYPEETFVTIGKCNAQTGSNDAYFPFREILNQFAGIQTRLLRISISNQPTGWLRSFVDSATEALIELGPDLIGTFVPGAALMARLATTTINASLKKLAESRSGNQEIKRNEVREQYSAIIRRAAEDATVILVVDDLQWADEASLDLFVHLTKSLRNHSVLIIGTYRSEGKEKALIDIRHDLQTQFGEIVIDLGDSNKKRGEQFIELFLAANKFITTKSENNEYSFQVEFFKRTEEGNALFSVELFRYLCEHQLIVQNEAGYWVESPGMDWNKLPTKLAKLAGLIEARFEALSPELREILDIASIEGQNFTAQVIMHFLKLSEYELLRILKAELEKRHNLVSEVRETPVGPTVLSNFRFVNATFHQYIYNDMSLGQRRLRHKEVAETLEKLYGVNSGMIAFQLAQHYELSYEPKKVIQYLNLAGEQIARVSDLKKAEEVFNRALSLAKTINDRKGEVDSKRYICGSILIHDEKYSEAEEQLIEALNLTRSINYLSGEIYILRNLGILARKKRHYTTATRYYLESLNLAKKVERESETESERQDAKDSQARAFNNLGTLAMAEKAYEDSEHYFNQRLKIDIELNNQNGKLFAFLNLGDLFWRKGLLAWGTKQEDIAKRQWASSRSYLDQALEIGHSTGAKSQIVSIEKCLADLAISEGKYIEAKAHLLKSLRTIIDSSLNSKIIGCLVSAANLLHKTEDTQHAILFACFVSIYPDSEDFDRELASRVISDSRIRNLPTNIDGIMDNYKKIADKEQLIQERKNLATRAFELIQSKNFSL